MTKSPMTALNKQALREAAEKATAGQWVVELCDEVYAVDGDDSEQIAMVFSDNGRSDAAFIAAASPTTMLAMLDGLEATESKCRDLAAELSAVDKIHNEAVFITDDHYEQCPPEVQNMIRSLAVLQIPAYDAFLTEVQASARNEGINYAASRLAAAFNHGFVDKPLAEVCDVVRMILDTKEELANSTLPAADGISGEYAEKFLAEFSAQLRKGAAL